MVPGVGRPYGFEIILCVMVLSVIGLLWIWIVIGFLMSIPGLSDLLSVLVLLWMCLSVILLTVGVFRGVWWCTH